jgi:aconitate hydratase
MPIIETTPKMVKKTYDTTRKNLDIVRKRLENRPLTLMEKVVFGHLDKPSEQELKPGEGFLDLRPDRVAMQDATAQMAILQFAQAQIPTVKVPSTVHCDHLIQAYQGSALDMARALDTNKEVYGFLASASNKFGIGFWKPGAGIIHQVVFEQYAFPGGMMIGTDSHTPNAGGLGMVACGVGGADAVDVMAGLPWVVKHPKKIAVVLRGKMSGWTSAKDIILKVAQVLTVKGGTNAIVEYIGDGARTLSCTGKGTITNMGAEIGATTSLFPYDAAMAKYLRATKRSQLADLADENKDLLEPDKECEADPKKYYDQVVEIDLSTLEPHVVGPHTPDLARPVSQMAKDAAQGGYPMELKAAMIGSCTNSSYEDISRAADIARQAGEKGAKALTPLMITPGSEQIYQTIKRDGQMAALEKIGATVMSNACGPCIGQWKRDDIQPGEVNSIISSFNRNFPARNDGNNATMSFIGSPEVVLAYALAGRLDVNPLRDEFLSGNGVKIRLNAPPQVDDLPSRGFADADAGYQAPAADGSKVEIVVDPKSDRLQLLQPFAAWDGKDYLDLPLLLKAKGKCTTDHISPAGRWLKYRGHLDNISNNMFLGAVSAFTGKPGQAKNQDSGEWKEPQEVARHYKSKGLRWVAVGDENYGEGSSREHAAMCPRFLGAAAILVKSFARIHETNLKKQGVLPLTFADAKDYDKILEDDKISVLGLSQLKPGAEVKLLLTHKDGSKDSIQARHSMNADQIAWFKAGSALNLIKQMS